MGGMIVLWSVAVGHVDTPFHLAFDGAVPLGHEYGFSLGAWSQQYGSMWCRHFFAAARRVLLTGPLLRQVSISVAVPSECRGGSLRYKGCSRESGPWKTSCA